MIRKSVCRFGAQDRSLGGPALQQGGLPGSFLPNRLRSGIQGQRGLVLQSMCESSHTQTHVSTLSMDIEAIDYQPMPLVLLYLHYYQWLACQKAPSTAAVAAAMRAQPEPGSSAAAARAAPR